MGSGWLPNTFSLTESLRAGFFALAGARTSLRFTQVYPPSYARRGTALLASQTEYASHDLVMARLRQSPANPFHSLLNVPAFWRSVSSSQLAHVPWKLTSPELLGAPNRQGENARPCRRAASYDAVTRRPNERPYECLKVCTVASFWMPLSTRANLKARCTPQ